MTPAQLDELEAAIARWDEGFDLTCDGDVLRELLALGRASLAPTTFAPGDRVRLRKDKRNGDRWMPHHLGTIMRVINSRDGNPYDYEVKLDDHPELRFPGDEFYFYAHELEKLS